MTKEAEVLFKLIQVALGHEEKISLPNVVKWEEVYELSLNQGVMAIACDGILAIEDCNIDENLRYMWIGQSMLVEQRYLQHQKAVVDLANFFCGQGIRMMLLKGYGFSLYYPIPEHRPSGDIDIFLFDAKSNIPLWKEGDKFVNEILNIKVDNSHHHHTVFEFEGQSVENHYDFINIYAHKSNRRIENILKSWAFVDCSSITESVVVPSANFNALFIVKHNASHFASTKMSIRNLLDWLLFVEHHSGIIDWVSLCDIYQRENLSQFVAVLNTIGVRYLGFPETLFPLLEKDEKLIARVLDDIISPEFKEKENGTLCSALWVKPRRWWCNRWKHNICYTDSLFSSFVYSLYAKFLKPGHFLHCY